jgi:hypothetical protein
VNIGLHSWDFPFEKAKKSPFLNLDISYLTSPPIHTADRKICNLLFLIDFPIVRNCDEMVKGFFALLFPLVISALFKISSGESSHSAFFAKVRPYLVKEMFLCINVSVNSSNSLVFYVSLMVGIAAFSLATWSRSKLASMSLCKDDAKQNKKNKNSINIQIHIWMLINLLNLSLVYTEIR